MLLAATFKPVKTSPKCTSTKFGEILVFVSHEFGARAFFHGFYEVRTSQLKAYCKNSRFLRGAYIAAYQITHKFLAKMLTKS